MSDGLLITMRSEQLVASLLGKSDQLHAAMVRVMNRLSIEVQGQVKSDKLTGQVLHVRSGTLRRSINRDVQDDGTNVTATVGTNVRYARVHEYGFDGSVDVRSFSRKTPSGGQAEVRAHTRQVRLPERSFLRSTVKEQADHIRADIKRAALEAVR